MRQLHIISVVLACVLLLFGACAPEPAPTPSPPAAVAPAPAPPVVAPTPKVPTKEAWEEEWQRLVDAARREGRIVAYTDWGPLPREALSTGFRKRYGIRAEFVSGRSADNNAKLLAERRAGLYLVDVFLHGATPIITTLKPAGALDPLEPALLLPELTDPEQLKTVWWDGKLGWADRDHLLLNYFGSVATPLAINTTLVKPGEIKSFNDLLEPKWKGKIVMNDPTTPGTGEKWARVFGDVVMGWDFMRKLAKQEPTIIRDERLHVEWLAHGKYAIATAPKPELMVEFQTAGAPIEGLVPAEGSYLTSGTGTVCLINRAPHPNAAKLFINWLLTTEAQIAISKAAGGHCLRLDVTTEHLLPLRVRKPGVKYIMSDREEFILKQPEQAKVIGEIFGPLIKK